MNSKIVVFIVIAIAFLALSATSLPLEAQDGVYAVNLLEDDGVHAIDGK